MCPKADNSDNTALNYLRLIMCLRKFEKVSIGDNTVTSSIRTAQVFPKLVGKKTHATLKLYRGMLKYIINYTLYLAHYDAYFHINDDA